MEISSLPRSPVCELAEQQMPVSHEKKFVYFHIPRCGGTSFQTYFNFATKSCLHGVERRAGQVLTLHHLTAPDMLRFGLLDHDTLQSYFKFTVIRDPFDRMASDFLWQKRCDRHGEYGELDFGGFLNKAERIIKEERYFEKIHYDHFRPMTDFCIQQGELLVDDILLLEDIYNELKRIREKIGDIELPKLNSSYNYEVLRTTENIDRVYDLYACDKHLHDNVSAILKTD